MRSQKISQRRSKIFSLLIFISASLASADDVVTIYSSPDTRLLQESFSIGSRDLAESILTNPTNYYTAADSTRFAKIIDKNQEPDLKVKIADASILNYSVTKNSETYRARILHQKRLSAEMSKADAAEYLRKELPKQNRVVRVDVLIRKEKPTK